MFGKENISRCFFIYYFLCILCIYVFKKFIFAKQIKIKLTMENQQNDNGLQIELTDDVAQGIYSNLAIISHSSSEFVVDFIRVMPGMPKAKVQSRIVLTPEHAKRLMMALIDNVKKYEVTFGEITLHGQNYIPPIMGPVGEA